MLKTIHDFSTFDYCVGGAVFALAVFVLGGITNMVLRESGFGIVLNGLLLFAGMVTGVFARAMTLGFQ